MIWQSTNRRGGNATSPCQRNLRSRLQPKREGKILVMFAVILPVLLGVIGLVIDGSLLMSNHRNLQHIADSAASAAAMDIFQGKPEQLAIASATRYIKNYNDVVNARIAINIPPKEGAYAGNANYVEVTITRPVKGHFIQVLRGPTMTTARARAVAGFEPATSGAAIVVLDARPFSESRGRRSFFRRWRRSPGLSIAGNEDVKVDGAVLVNTTWGAYDENGDPAGSDAGPPYGVQCDRGGLVARDLRVAGGVDDPNNYKSLHNGDAPPLQANRFPVSDPLGGLPEPTLVADSKNVLADVYGGVDVKKGKDHVLRAGIYDWINVAAGHANFKPGVYIIRNVNPDTGRALSIEGPHVKANGVMFYITNNTHFAPTLGLPDDDDDDDDDDDREALPSYLSFKSSHDSVVIDVQEGSRFTPISDSKSPFDGMILFQSRSDRRHISITKSERTKGKAPSSFAGCVYAKRGSLSFADVERSDSRFVVGSMEIVNLGDCEISPTQLLPPAKDVFLVE